jgi:hypothetical protein
MSRWWRAYSEAMDDPKLMNLPPEVFRAWFVFLCISSKNSGKIPKNSVKFSLRCSENKTEKIVAILLHSGLIETLDDNNYQPHNWKERQYDSDCSSERVRRHRKKQHNGGETFHETPNETFRKRPQITDTDTEAERKKETRASGALGACASDGFQPSSGKSVTPPGWPSDFREQFWGAYPHKIGKADAIHKLERVGKSGQIGFDAMMSALFRYANKTDDRPWCNPATWLNQGRWLDSPSPSNGRKNGHGAIISAADDLVKRAHENYARTCEENNPRDGKGPDVAWPISEWRTN